MTREERRRWQEEREIRKGGTGEREREQWVEWENQHSAKRGGKRPHSVYMCRGRHTRCGSGTGRDCRGRGLGEGGGGGWEEEVVVVEKGFRI